jgi:nitrogen fixation NifU-like protein
MDDLEDLYREIILDHYKHPRNQGVLDDPAAIREEGFNPLCGDEVKLSILVRNGVLADIRVDGHGCSISRSSASLMSEAVKGKPLEEVDRIIERFKAMVVGGEPVEGIAGLRELGELAALQGVVKFPVRVKCATLAWNSLQSALATARGESARAEEH